MIGGLVAAGADKAQAFGLATDGGAPAPAANFGDSHNPG